MGKFEDPQEKIMLACIFIISLYMYLEAQNFPTRPSVFPQLMALLTMIFIIILFLNSVISKYGWGIVDNLATKNNSDLGIEGDYDDNDVTIGDRELKIWHFPVQIYLSILLLIYVISGYLFGLLWVTPIIAACYAKPTLNSWTYTAAIAILSFLIAYSFVYILNLPITSGILTDELIGFLVIDLWF